MATSVLRKTIEESIATKQRLLLHCLPQIEALCELAVKTLRDGGKIMFCGNGGSACDAAHAAGELVGTFEDKTRKGYAAIALGFETPALTAIANDMSYEVIFSRQLEAIGRKGDLLVGYSTSGRSKNVVAAMQKAKELGIATAALLGENKGPCSELADVAVQVPSTNTARIQESHLLCTHLLCAAVELALGGRR